MLGRQESIRCQVGHPSPGLEKDTIAARRAVIGSYNGFLKRREWHPVMREKILIIRGRFSASSWSQVCSKSSSISRHEKIRSQCSRARLTFS